MHTIKQKYYSEFRWSHECYIDTIKKNTPAKFAGVTHATLDTLKQNTTANSAGVTPALKTNRIYIGKNTNLQSLALPSTGYKRLQTLCRAELPKNGYALSYES